MMTIGAKIVILASIAAVVWVITAPLLARALVVERPLAHADAIIVLSGAKAYRERTQRAAELYRGGIAPLVFITNDGNRAGWSVIERTNPSSVDLETRELVAGGVPRDAIVVLRAEVFGTDHEAKEMLAVAGTRSITSLLVVTSGYHTRRSLRTFEKIFTGTGVEIGIEHPIAGRDSPGPWTWWLTPRGWQMVAYEYVKIAGYYVLY